MIHLLCLLDTITININVLRRVVEHIISDFISSWADVLIITIGKIQKSDIMCLSNVLKQSKPFF